MEKQITHLIINYIWMDKRDISVGATDNERWRWDTEEGMSGVDAKTLILVTLTNNGKGNITGEKADFFCLPSDPTRKLVMSSLTGLFNVAWAIKNSNISILEARKRFFGKKVNDFNSLS